MRVRRKVQKEDRALANLACNELDYYDHNMNVHVRRMLPICTEATAN